MRCALAAACLSTLLALSARPAGADALAERSVLLEVPYVTQLDGSAYAGSNCGPAVLAMALAYATGERHSALALRRALGWAAADPEAGTDIADLARLARRAGALAVLGEGAASLGWSPERVRAQLERGRVLILLTRLALLPGYAVESDLEHYILVVGAGAGGFHYHDPALATPEGTPRTLGAEELRRAQRATSAPGQGAAIGAPPRLAAVEPS